MPPPHQPLYLHMNGGRRHVLTNSRERKPKVETKTQSFVFSDKKQANSDALFSENFITTKKQQMLPMWEEPTAASHEFGEHGGVNMSIEASATFKVMEHETLGHPYRLGWPVPPQMGPRVMHGHPMCLGWLANHPLAFFFFFFFFSFLYFWGWGWGIWPKWLHAKRYKPYQEGVDSNRPYGV
jgi:hypothetical protein